jgi:hypothetical protein
MTDEEIDRIEALATGATRTPWATAVVDSDEVVVRNAYSTQESGDWVCAVGYSEYWETRRNADFISACSTAVPDLIAEVRKLKAALRSIRDGDSSTLTGAQHIAAMALT